ncbi:transcriptional regulator, TetR family protein [Nocardioidaceae bacterium Broad-1]|uniref:TetR/AcrR family transcriptional regulator n=1 Tax=Nocardioides luteus TaxID=1844 RepID=UPI000202931A|nr:TetR/AcrR family transcriptional regulator [Nocardioides luteus]EGD45476.1 transcriptional regulator, TetR family protein [Nocardioidaceae bacterium Broad-1]MBG6094161.1 AcrR family transcriptional regulator [Nocardioides luteus]
MSPEIEFGLGSPFLIEHREKWVVKPKTGIVWRVNAKTGASEPRKLTGKGQATRARILEQAANLIYAHGVHATNNEQIRRATGVSGSQLNHYFPTKEKLVLAVIQWQAERVLAVHRGDEFDGFDSIDALRRWATFYVGYERACREGCTLGSLASEIIKADLDVRDELASAFGEWRDVFRDGMSKMQRLGRMRADADPTQLANLLLAAFQGGMMLAQVAREITPLEDALQAAIDHVQTFATEVDPDVGGAVADGLT